MSARGILRGTGCLLIALSACTSPPPAERLNAPPQGTTERPSRLQEPFVSMVDNAILHDMTVADLHFVPHTAELNGTGVARLDRMTYLLDVYGGIVRYETFEKDESLVAGRLAHVQEYLESTGCDMSRVSVKTMISGGRGMRASDAIRIMKAGTAGAAGSSDGAAGAAQSPASSPQG